MTIITYYFDFVNINFENGEKIKKAREQKGITQKQLAELIGAKHNSISNWEKDQNKPDIAYIEFLSSALDVDPGYFFSNDVKKNITIDELSFIEKYRKLDDLGREIINLITDAELKRITPPPTTPESKIIDFQEEKEKRELPYYTIGASAGNGNFLATNDYILIEVDDYVPQQANYALKVKGDSMEPKYHDGDIVYVKTQKSIENGEIGIFCIDDNVYIKKLECVDGKCKLISLNPSYDPIEIKESNEFKCFGKVLN